MLALSILCSLVMSISILNSLFVCGKGERIMRGSVIRGVGLGGSDGS